MRLCITSPTLQMKCASPNYRKSIKRSIKNIILLSELVNDWLTNYHDKVFGPKLYIDFLGAGWEQPF